MCQRHGCPHLFHAGTAAAAIGGKRKKSHPWLPLQDRPHVIRRRYGNRSQLACIRFRIQRTVCKYDHVSFRSVKARRLYKGRHRSRRDTFLQTDDMQRRAEHIAGRMNVSLERTIRPADCFQHHGIGHRIPDLLPVLLFGAMLFDGSGIILLIILFHQCFRRCGICTIDCFHACQIHTGHFCGFVYNSRVMHQHRESDTGIQYYSCSQEHPFRITFRKNDTLWILFCFFDQSVKKHHGTTFLSNSIILYICAFFLLYMYLCICTFFLPCIFAVFIVPDSIKKSTETTRTSHFYS